MPSRAWMLCSFPSLLLFAACATPGPKLIGSGADDVASSIDAAWRAHSAAAIARDAEAIVGIYADDAVYVVDGQRPIIDAICRHFEMDEVTEEAKENIIAANQELFDKERQKLAKFYQHHLTADQQAWVDSLKPCFPEAF